MARKYGRLSRTRFLQETTFGVAATGNYAEIPFVENDLAADQGWMENDVIHVNQTRDPADPVRDVQRVGGNLIVPVELRDFGWYLKGLFGAPSTSGSSNYVHTFKSGAATLPSFTVEKMYAPNPFSADQLVGMMINSFSLSGRFGTNRLKCTLGWLGAQLTKLDATGAGTPTTNAFTPFLDSQAVVKRGGTDLGVIKEFQLNYSNNLEAVELAGKSLVTGYDTGMGSFGGNLTARFVDDTLLDDAIAGGAVDLEFVWTIGANQSLSIDVPRCFLGRPRRGISNAGGIDASFSIEMGSYDASSSAMLTATLANQVASYPDPS